MGLCSPSSSELGWDLSNQSVFNSLGKMRTINLMGTGTWHGEEGTSFAGAEFLVPQWACVALKLPTTRRNEMLVRVSMQFVCGLVESESAAGDWWS